MYNSPSPVESESSVVIFAPPGRLDRCLRVASRFHGYNVISEVEIAGPDDPRIAAGTERAERLRRTLSHTAFSLSDDGPRLTAELTAQVELSLGSTPLVFDLTPMGSFPPEKILAAFENQVWDEFGK